MSFLDFFRRNKNGNGKKGKKFSHLGNRLIRAGKISREQLDSALDQQKGSAELLGQTLVRLSLVSDDQLKPYLNNCDPEYPSTSLDASQLDSPIFSEFYRLQSQIRFALFSDDPLKTILITSSIPSEGKTLCSTYMAIITAVTLGKRVLLIDADLRKPSIHKLFHLPNLFGLSDVLIKTVPFEKAVQKTKLANLDVLTTGTRSTTPTQMISSATMENLIERLSTEYELVFIDSPPVLVTPDASLLGPLVQGTILVIEAGRSREREAEKTLAKLRQANTNMLGIILNKYSSKNNHKYYNHYYSKPE